MSLTKISSASLLSLLTKLFAEDTNAINCPLKLIDGL
jgi:hypothetical protein